MFIGDLILNFRETRQKNDVIEDHLLQGLLAILTSSLAPSDGYYLKSNLGF